ncbi:MAG: hypothetical protein R3296_07995 [Oleiphilaceae bacterium]|nr:hypothetical protein [Oleiphilaceae bacterium]
MSRSDSRFKKCITIIMRFTNGFFAVLLIMMAFAATQVSASGRDLGPTEGILDETRQFGKDVQFLFSESEDEGQRALIEQHGNFNQARIDQNGISNKAEIHQQGSGNDGSISQSGEGNRALIRQQGHDNSARIHQTGDYNRALISQKGSGLSATLNQDGGNFGVGVVRSRGVPLEFVEQIGTGLTLNIR